ncbi:MAG TPA: SDR family NAD(P)-dependent oxidoreductase, partial [Rectinemataceae bacterium]|nr:SDR family NAD(P)-dependent oxidoreductase [Rectinemataceae bacterium]
MKSLLSGKVLWITGSSSGIGAALAEEASNRGARLLLSGRNEEALGSVAARCKTADVAILPFDLADPRKRAEAAGRAATFFGPVDVLLLNAGV